MPLPIVILTGAGISKESGLSTFRDADGIWATVKIEDVATPEAFACNPEKVQAFYNTRRAGLLAQDIAPNDAHVALARLEKDYSGDVLIVTQNIDDLHERAGSKNVLHMHGELLKARCLSCEKTCDCRFDLSNKIDCPLCGEKNLRPHIVWFGEMPFFMDEIFQALASCGRFVSIGTSGNVYPAAGFVDAAGKNFSTSTIELNLEPSEGASLFDEARYGPATKIVPAWVDEILSKS